MLVLSRNFTGEGVWLIDAATGRPLGKITLVRRPTEKDPTGKVRLGFEFGKEIKIYRSEMCDSAGKLRESQA